MKLEQVGGVPKEMLGGVADRLPIELNKTRFPVFHSRIGRIEVDGRGGSMSGKVADVIGMSSTISRRVEEIGC
jgi:hypothetical protein